LAGEEADMFGPFPLMSKGERVKKDISFSEAIWLDQFGFPSIPKGEIVGIDVCCSVVGWH